MATSNFKVKNGVEVTEVLYVSGSCSLRNVGILGPVDPDVSGITVHGDISASGTIFVAGSAVGGSSSSSLASGAGGSLNELQYNNSGILDGAEGLIYQESDGFLGLGIANAQERLTVSGNISGAGFINIGSVVVAGKVDGRDVAGDAANVVANSGSWNSVYSTLKANSAEYESTFATLKPNSGGWTDTESTVRTNSGTWTAGASLAFKTIALSGNRPNAAIGADVVADSTTDTLTLCAGPNIVLVSPVSGSTTDVITISGAPNTGDVNVNTTVKGSSGSWDSTNTTVKGSSGSWDSTNSTLNANSARYDRTALSLETNVVPSTANWNSTYNQVQDSTTDLNVDSGTLVVDKSVNRVGIGTTAPNEALTVVGNISAQGSLSASSIHGSADSDLSIESDKNINLYLDHDDDGSFHKFQIYEDGDVFFAVAEDGKAAIGGGVTSNSIDGLTVYGDISAQNLSAAGNISLTENQRIYFEADKATWIETDSADRLRFVAGGKQMLLLDQDTGDRAVFGFGTKVGINIGNNATPGEELTVAGNISANGDVFAKSVIVDGDTLYFRSANGTVNKETGPKISTTQGGSVVIQASTTSGAAGTVVVITSAGTVASVTSGEETRVEIGGYPSSFTTSLSTLATVFASGGNSKDWNSTYNVVKATSATWADNIADIAEIAALSATWTTAYTRSNGVVTIHSDVSDAGSGAIITGDERDKFTRAWTNVSSNSSQWAEVKADIAEVAGVSATWTTAYTRSNGVVTIHSDVSDAGSGQIITADERDKFTRAWTNVSSNSSQWAEVKADIAEVAAVSANWTTGYNNSLLSRADLAGVAVLSANWTTGYNNSLLSRADLAGVAVLSANWTTGYNNSLLSRADLAGVAVLSA